MKKSLCLSLVILVPVAWAQEPRELFIQHCQSCHGSQGMGDGPASPGLNPPPRNLQQRPYKYGCCPPRVFQTITHGIAGTAMPGFESVIPENQRRQLADYVFQLGRKVEVDDKP